MKIAVLAHCHHPIKQPFPGGLEAHTSLIADELVRRGHRVTLFAKAGSRSLADVHPVVDAQFTHGSAPDQHGVDQSQAVVDRGMERAVQAIDAGDFDVVLNNSLNPIPYAALGDHPMLTLLHTPATLERTLEVLEAPGWRPGARHAYAAVSEYTARDWRRFLPEVHCIPNGIELAAWDPRQPYCPVPDLAVWAARITPEKNLPLAIAAARAAGMRLEFSGPISDRRHFGEEIEPLLGADVRYAGHLTHDRTAGLLRPRFGVRLLAGLGRAVRSGHGRGDGVRNSRRRAGPGGGGRGRRFRRRGPGSHQHGRGAGRRPSGTPSGSTAAACGAVPSGSTSRSCSTGTKPCCSSWRAPVGPWLSFTRRSTSLALRERIAN